MRFVVLSRLLLITTQTFTDFWWYCWIFSSPTRIPDRTVWNRPAPDWVGRCSTGWWNCCWNHPMTSNWCCRMMRGRCWNSYYLAILGRHKDWMPPPCSMSHWYILSALRVVDWDALAQIVVAALANIAPTTFSTSETPAGVCSLHWPYHSLRCCSSCPDHASARTFHSSVEYLVAFLPPACWALSTRYTYSSEHPEFRFFTRTQY